jgi:adenosylhomocysteine nucleosidase
VLGEEMSIGIIGAMDTEIKDLLAQMNDYTIEEYNQQKYYLGKIAGTKVIVARCGIGKVNAAIFTQLMILKFNPEYIINTGVAGSLKDENKIGTVIISEDVTYHDVRVIQMESTFPFVNSFTADTCLIKKMKYVTRKDGNIKYGTIVSGDAFINEDIKKDEIRLEYNAECVDMEAAAIGHTCYINQIPFIIIRTICDNADESAIINFLENEARFAKISSKLVVDFLGFKN